MHDFGRSIAMSECFGFRSFLRSALCQATVRFASLYTLCFIACVAWLLLFLPFWRLHILYFTALTVMTTMTQRCFFLVFPWPYLHGRRHDEV